MAVPQVKKMSMSRSMYNVVEFKDGVQLVPSIWIMDDDQQSYWPKYTKQIEINNAIAKQKEPESDWPLHKIIRILGCADSYKDGMDKLKLSEKYSDIDSNSDLEKEKKKRHNRARKVYGTDDETETNEEECVQLPKPPKPVNVNKMMQVTNRSRVEFKKTNLPNKQCHRELKKSEVSLEPEVLEMNFHEQAVGETEALELLKVVLKKINKLVIQIDMLTTEVKELKEQVSIGKTDLPEDIDFKLPLHTLHEVKKLEEDLKESTTYQNLALYLKAIGKGRSIVDATTILLKRLLINDVAVLFTFGGHRRGKECFRDLLLHKVILKVIRLHYQDATEQQINKAIEQWLIQGNLRRTRELNKQFTNEDDQ